MSEKGNDLLQIGGRLSICRQNKNMTQEELAYRLGITPQALSKWERGMSFPDISMLADLSRLLEVSTDYLLGTGAYSAAEQGGGAMQPETADYLRASLCSLEMVFGKELVPLFVDNHFVGGVAEIRNKLSQEGIWMPVTRFRDHPLLGDREYMILAYGNVLYSQVVEKVDEETLAQMFRNLSRVVQEKYHEILSPDIVKCLVDNLQTQYPALIDGIIPEKVPYVLLTEVLRIVCARGNSARYLPKIIEAVERALYHSPNLSAEELAQQAAAQIERKDNFYVVLHEREKK